MNLKYIGKNLVTFLIIAGVFAPWVTILIAPEDAFAQVMPPVRVPTASLPPSLRQFAGQEINWNQAAAGGAASVGTCLAAAGITLGGGLAAIGSMLGITRATQVAGEAAGSASAVVSGGLMVPTVAAITDLELRKIQVQLSVISTTLTSTFVTIKSMQAKEDVLDCIAWAIAKMIWRAVAASIVTWINSGFNGRPAFVQDLGRFLLGVADEAIGNVIASDSALAFLCSPFRLQVRIALANAYARRAPSCTLTQIVANIQNFTADFSQGGWPAWLELTTIAQNNPYGGFVLAETNLQIGIATAQGQQIKLLDWGMGFLSKTEQRCTSPSGGARPEDKVCTSVVVTPGQVIARQIADTLNNGQVGLLLADEFDEIMGALVTQLLTKALGSLFGLTQPTAYQDDFYRNATFIDEFSQEPFEATSSDLISPDLPGGSPEGSLDLISQIQTSISVEQELQRLNQGAITSIDISIQKVDQLISCWNSKGSATSSTAVADPADRAQALVEAQTARFTQTSLEQKKSTFTIDITLSQQRVTRFETLIGQAASVSTQSQLDGILREFYGTRSGAATQGSLILLDSQLAQLDREMTLTDTTTAYSLDRCTYFPFAPPGQFDDLIRSQSLQSPPPQQ